MGLALGSLVVTMVLEGSGPLAVVLVAPLVLVLGATLGAGIAGAALRDVHKLRSWARSALAPARVPSAAERIAELVDLAGRARRIGFLALDRQLGDVRDPFLLRGLRLAIDGVPPEELRTVLAAEIEGHRGEDLVAARFFAR